MTPFILYKTIHASIFSRNCLPHPERLMRKDNDCALHSLSERALTTGVLQKIVWKNLLDGD
jgi:hypothetical protein